jgi:hypothetical protein
MKETDYGEKTYRKFYARFMLNPLFHGRVRGIATGWGFIFFRVNFMLDKNFVFLTLVSILTLMTSTLSGPISSMKLYS